MRRAIIDTLIVVGALLVIFLVVMVVIFGRQAGVFSQTLSQGQIIKANEQCRAFTATALRKDDQLIDSDFDDMADVCDVCPNNYLSSEGDEVDTDKDKDGLSEEGLDHLESPYNRGEYVVHLCDKEALPSRPPQCANDWDEVRGKCRCGIFKDGLRAKTGFSMDRCARQDEWDQFKRDYSRPLIRQLLKEVYGHMRELRFAQALTLWDDRSTVLLNAGFEVSAPFMDEAESLIEVAQKPVLDIADIEALRKFIRDDHDPGIMPREAVGLLKAFAGSLLVDAARTVGDKHDLLTQAENDMGGLEAQPRMAEVLIQQAHGLTSSLSIDDVAQGRVLFSDKTSMIVQDQDGYIPSEIMLMDPLLILQRRLVTPVFMWRTSEGQVPIMPAFEVDRVIVEDIAAKLNQYCQDKRCEEIMVPWGQGYILWRAPEGALDLQPPAPDAQALPRMFIETAEDFDEPQGGLLATLRLWAYRVFQ